MALNEGLSWADAGSKVTDAGKGTTVRDAFIDKKAEKVLLKTGLKLYKFNSQGRTLTHNGGASPWWFPTEPFGKFDVGLEEVLKFAKANGVRSTEYARLIAAVTEEWNVMDVIMKAELTDNAYGFFGQCSNQSKKEGSKVNLTGRAYQFYIPGLTDKSIKLLSVSAAP